MSVELIDSRAETPPERHIFIGLGASPGLTRTLLEIRPSTQSALR